MMLAETGTGEEAGTETGAGEPAARRQALDAMVPLVYDELRRLAQRQLAREQGPRSLQPTTLVHEAYLKLAAHAPRATSRAHLLAIAAHAMRQVLVDRARERRAQKRGGEWARVTLTDGVGGPAVDAEGLLTLNDAIERLEPRQRQVVECRYFAGLSDEEIAEALGVTVRTVGRDWVKARAWLNRALTEAPAAVPAGDAP
ncbi:MAG: sigma-70 family RNA polymerase sigma factor [Gemmatimonadaceae bacterium]|nr:sigma-70 family RNA polymerase sigma factor [Gemmatimonadaceae bacterium]